MIGDAKSTMLYALQAGIGVVWIVAAVGKVRIPTVILADNVRRLVGGPDWAVSPLSRALPIGELVIGLLLIIGWNTPLVSAISAALFFFFAFIVGRATIRGSLGEGGCGCFGRRRPPVAIHYVNGPKIVARNFLLANLSLIVALAGRCACGR
jgi:uncharacterized membrane protein YphA (DoxX/SURF4 family)